MQEGDLFIQRNVPHVRVRVERTMKFVSRKLMDTYEALGGETMEELGIDPDAQLDHATTQVIRGWAHGRDGITGWMAQWSMFDSEVIAVNHVKVFVDGKLVHEEELVAS